MKDFSGKYSLSSGQADKSKDNAFKQTKAKYPVIYEWWSNLVISSLSETGYRNYAIRFKFPLEEFKSVIAIFEKGAGNE
jgi:hypothetical protein